MNKKLFYALYSEFCKTLANPKRQEILDNLRRKEMPVKELMETTGIPQANLSQHLSLLRSKGIVTARRQGNTIYYSLTHPKIIKAFDLIGEVLRDLLKSQSETISSVTRRKK